MGFLQLVVKVKPNTIAILPDTKDATAGTILLSSTPAQTNAHTQARCMLVKSNDNERQITEKKKHLILIDVIC